VSGALIASAVSEAHPDQAVVYLPGRDELVSFLTAQLRPGDLCLTLGAGDLTQLPDQLLGSL
jgi:UDP-N-acetylmuramate--alanine ligase